MSCFWTLIYKGFQSSKISFWIFHFAIDKSFVCDNILIAGGKSAESILTGERKYP